MAGLATCDWNIVCRTPSRGSALLKHAAPARWPFFPRPCAVEEGALLRGSGQRLAVGMPYRPRLVPMMLAGVPVAAPASPSRPAATAEREMQPG